jgi:hypothetical protein
MGQGTVASASEVSVAKGRRGGHSPRAARLRLLYVKTTSNSNQLRRRSQ